MHLLYVQYDADLVSPHIEGVALSQSRGFLPCVLVVLALPPSDTVAQPPGVVNMLLHDPVSFPLSAISDGSQDADLLFPYSQCLACFQRCLVFPGVLLIVVASPPNLVLFFPRLFLFRYHTIDIPLNFAPCIEAGESWCRWIGHDGRGIFADCLPRRRLYCYMLCL
ncbi:hypothetical protein BKA70DRAFT_208679 [Coprinopsis sp. MPI-PUGE-AT-0042]|nr:hypothetical protein BKA70DRAFT_208679 [Coprinopsis sp. MPI-PUGE-AT-0042]